MISQPIAKTLPKNEISPTLPEEQPPSSFLHRHPSPRPTSARRGKYRFWLLAALALLILGGGGLGAMVFLKNLSGGKPYYYGLVDEARMQTLRIQVVERGEVESAANIDIRAEVKTDTTKTSNIKIKWIIEDGTHVKKGREPSGYWPSVLGMLFAPHFHSPLLAAGIDPGKPGDLLLELVATPLQDELNAQQIVVNKAELDWMGSEQNLKITQSQNEIDEKEAKVTLDVSGYELKKYVEGDYYVARNDLGKKLEDAQSELKQWQDRAAWTQRMYYLKYVSQSQAIADEAKRKSAQIAFDNFQKELEVLDTYTRPKMVEELKGKVEKAQLTLDQKKEQSRFKTDLAEFDRKTKKSIFEQERDKLYGIKAEIQKCKIYAPRDGLVVYFVSQQSRSGMGNQTSIIAPGELVTFDQKLMQIPDLTRMQVKARIHEAMVKYLRDENSDDPAGWQQASLRIDAFSDRAFKGHVKSVASVASKQDFLSSDVKVYETIIAIDEELKNKELKPGMSAEVTILAYESPEPVLTIPIQAVVGSITMGKERKCYVINEQGYAEERDIVIGRSNERVVEVLSGLKEGEKVALDPTSLLPPESPLRASKPGKQQAPMEGGPGGGQKGKGDGEFQKPGDVPGPAGAGVPPGAGGFPLNGKAFLGGNGKGSSAQGYGGNAPPYTASPYQQSGVPDPSARSKYQEEMSPQGNGLAD